MAAAAWLAACGGEPEAAATRDEAAVHGFDLATLEEVFDQEGASLGSVAFPVSCSDEAAESMRRGLALLHNMTFVEAEGAFRSASEQDPDCALAYWGMAMTYLHPLWPDVPSTESFERGWDLLQEARSRGLGTEREEGYVTALEAYYRDGPNRDEPSRLASYAEAWAAVHAEHPDDPEAALFRALSLLATAPGSDQSFATQREAGAMAEAVLAAIPDHPGAHHYVIHAYDVPPLAEEALPAARSYGKVAPENAHALHMTSHIFTRVGSWEESIDYNVRSADAAARHPINGATSHHHLHAVDYLAYAYLQRGQNDRAEEILRHLEALDGPVFDHAASAYAFAAVPSRIALETHDWSRAAAVETDWPSQVAWERYPHLAAIPEFARALGSARTGDLSAAEAAIARLSQLEAEARALPQSYDWGTQVKIQELGARAWLAYAQGRADQALALMTEAADLEAGSTKNPVTPGEVLPAMELLGDLLLDLGQYAEAQQAYERALTRSPNRFNSLYGAGRAAQLQGDDQAAGEYYRHLHSVVAEDATGRSELEATREFLKG
jgi:tetratricopeptide (TPR) repeat protein